MASNTTKKKTTTAKESASSKKGSTSGKSTSGKSVSAKNTSAKKTSVKKTPVKKTSVSRSMADRQPDAYAPDMLAAKECTSPLIIREAVLWLILAACILLYISYFGVGGYLGEVISDVSFGLFGIMSYVFPVLVFISAAFLISNRGSRVASVKFLSAAGLFVCLCSFADLFMYMQDVSRTASKIYEICASEKSGGGVIGGVICSVLRPALGAAGTGLILLILSIVFFVLITQKSLMRAMKNESRKVYRSARESSARRREARQREMEEWQEWEAREAHRQPVFLQENVQENASAAEEQEVLERQAYQKQQTEKTQPEHIPVQTESASKRTRIEVPVLFPVQGRENRAGRRVSGVTMDTKITGNPQQIGAEVHQIMPGRGSYIDLDEMERSKCAAKEQKTAQEDVPILYNDSNDKIPLHIEGIEETDSKPYVEETDMIQEENSPVVTETVYNKAPASSQTKKNPRSSKEEIAEGIADVQAEMEKTAEAVKKEYVFHRLIF